MNIKKMWSPYLFTRQQALKLGYFYRLRINNSNPLHTGLRLGYLKDAKFYRESKASFTDMSSIASFNPFLIAWLYEYCIFRTVPWLACSLRLGQNTPSTHGTIFQNKKTCSTIKCFFLQQLIMFFFRLF